MHCSEATGLTMVDGGEGVPASGRGERCKNLYRRKIPHLGSSVTLIVAPVQMTEADQPPPATTNCPHHRNLRERKIEK